ADRHPGHFTLRETSALAAAERGEAPVRGERVGQPEARIVPRRRVLWPRIAEADHGAQASALFAALGLLRLLGLGRRRSRSPTTLGVGLGRRAALGGALALFFFLADLADQLGLGHLGRGLRGGRRHFL